MKNSILFLSGVVALFLLISCSSEKSPDNKTPDKENPNKDPKTPDTGTTTIISGYDCQTGILKGVLVAGVPATEVTKPIRVTAAATGAYSISTNTVNGIKFEGSGKFETKGVQDVILIATGTPTKTGKYEFALASTDCRFELTVDKNPSSNGAAVVSGYDCSGSVPKGKLVAGTAAVGVTQTITAAVTTQGSYDISTTTVNGIKFAGIGTFSASGTQTIELTAIGTPAEKGISNFALSDLPATITNNCNFSREITVQTDIAPETTDVSAICDGVVQTEVVDITVVTGRRWMDRNLGAIKAATSKDDYKAYGCLYQWGRGNDGHASIRWISSTIGRGINPSTPKLSVDNTPEDSQFITPGDAGNDWRSKPTNTLWKEPNEINNPCPTGYRIPTYAEFGELLTRDGPDNSSIKNMDIAYKSKLKFVAAGSRTTDGSFIDVGSKGRYWTSTYPTYPKEAAKNIYSFYFNSDGAGETQNNFRAAGLSVRCIKKE